MRKTARCTLFSQKTHGQRGTKPTSLLALRLPGLAEYMRKRNTPVEHDLTCESDAPLIGYDEEKREFRTTAAKEYPNSMNCGLAMAMLDAVRNATTVQGDPFEGGSLLSVLKDFLVVQYDPYIEELQHNYASDYDAASKLDNG